MKIEIRRHTGQILEEEMKDNEGKNVIDGNGIPMIKHSEIFEVIREYEGSEIEEESLFRRARQTAEMMSLIEKVKYSAVILG